MNNNTFKKINAERRISSHVKSELVAEIEAIRNSSVLVELFVGNFIHTFTKSIDVNSTQKDSKI